eukprot:gene8784-9722_t
MASNVPAIRANKRQTMQVFCCILLAFAIAPTASANEALNQFNELANVLACVSTSRMAVNCEKSFRISWMNLDPYFSKVKSANTTAVQFKGMFYKVLQTLQLTCKYQCLGQEVINVGETTSVIVHVTNSNNSKNVVTFHFDKEPMSSYTELKRAMHQEAKNMTTTIRPRLFLPVAVTESYVDTVNGFPFLFTVDAQELLYVERKVKGDLLALLWRGVMNSWELFIIVLLLASLFGMLVWLAERNFNKECFPYEFSTGAAVGFWFTCVTMTTVGYGDKAPKTVFGRITTLSWMLISLCLFPLLMANFTNLIRDGTVNSLYGVKVAVLKDGPEATCASKENADIKEYATYKDMLVALQEQKTDGALIEKNTAIFLKRNIESKQLRIAKTFKCELRMGIVAEPRIDTKNRKTVVESIRQLKIMNQQCLTEKCRKKMRGEAINQALQGAKSSKIGVSEQSTMQLLIPLIILGSIVGVFILCGCTYDVIRRNRPSAVKGGETVNSDDHTSKHHNPISNVFTNLGRRFESHEMSAK